MPETIRETASGSASEDVYGDYYDRLTYEDVLRAVMHAVYRPQPKVGDDDGTPPGFSIPVRPDVTVEPVDAAKVEKARAKLEKGFRRLIGNFCQGAANEEYLETIPASYLAEVYVIIMAFLREVWRQGLLEAAFFVEQSWKASAAFWGEIAGTGAWSAIESGFDRTELDQIGERLELCAQTWLQVYAAGWSLTESEKPEQFVFARWLRYLSSVAGPPDVLDGLQKPDYDYLWHHGMPAERDFRLAEKVVTHLYKYLGLYNEETLIETLRTWPGTRVEIGMCNVAQRSQVPELEVRMPLIETDLTPCLRAFQVFLCAPTPKHFARACFTSTEQRAAQHDIRSVRFLFLGDARELIFAIERESGQFDPAITEDGVTVESIRALESISDMWPQAPAQVVSVERTPLVLACSAAEE